ncbi:hypothetical protein [Nesterenkonia aerolata]|uniref:Uncharacterized protein n=1 Tax=Nesterenkonia aerolata TaxID=3074079 RepID=A0ABU2DRS5_9MICC|nr:hypothetical protein [Nesterenkonia sp. LY-0111]MDR8019217.1 hypothetical protein [Nesterenkonia sp. LY-0111]
MGTKRITAAVLVAGLGLTACAYDGGEETEETAAPAPEETEGGSPESETPSSDEQEEESSSEEEEIDPEDEEESLQAELEAGLLEEAVEAFVPEEGDTYAQSWLMITPRVSLWTVVEDEHGNPVEIDVTKYNCTGEAIVEGAGELEHVEENIYRAHWEDDSDARFEGEGNPRREGITPSSRMTLDEEVLSFGGGSEFDQSADIEAEIEDHIFQCRLIGEMVLP